MLQTDVPGVPDHLQETVEGIINFLPQLVAGSVRRVTDRTEIDQLVMNTPLGGALAVLVAADALAVELLSEWIATAVSYLPAFVAGALIIVVGFVLSDFLADIVAHTKTVTETSYTGMFADGVRVFLYFIAIVIGIAFGLGGRDYVATNIGDWLPGRAPDPEPSPIVQPDGGEKAAD